MTYSRPNLVGLGQFFVSVRPQAGMLFTRTVVPCKDGYVTLMFGGGAFAGSSQSSRALVDWANTEGYALEMKDFDSHHVGCGHHYPGRE